VFNPCNSGWGNFQLNKAAMDNLWHLGDELRSQPKLAEDRQWSLMTSKLAEITRSKGERMNDFDYGRMNTAPDAKQWDKVSYHHHDGGQMDHHLNHGLMNLDLKMNDAAVKNPFRSVPYNMSQMYPKGGNASVNAFKMNVGVNKYSNSPSGKEASGNHIGGNNNGSNSNGNNNSAVDKRFKTLPTSEMLPRNEVLGGYIFVCNNDTMQEDLKRQLFGTCVIVPRKSWHMFLQNNFDTCLLVIASQDLFFF
jgi:hypothetical protein